MSKPKVLLKDTVNLPKTDFPIRAGLAEKEPALLARWAACDLYSQLLKQNQTHPPYILHDGPPYPNGDIHAGHALNKLLKDIVTRSRFMMGQTAPYIPGWDCHGLPIETQVIKHLKAGKKEAADTVSFRQQCESFALDYVDRQRNEFKRLGIIGQWDTPYLTLSPAYEAGVVKAFGQLANEGIVYQGKKPIHWCCTCETALAEAEIEYMPHQSLAITVMFHVKHCPDTIREAIGAMPLSVCVWTTTPWTLPANVGLAVNAGIDYGVFQYRDQFVLVATAQWPTIATSLGEPVSKAVVTLKGAELVGWITTHPFIDRDSTVVTAGFVTAEDGTGVVHIAPGHGQDDYVVGLAHEWPIIMPVDAKGRFTDAVPQWQGRMVFEANAAICDHLQTEKRLVSAKSLSHSYPHCWRCHNPVIFRATKQWFIAMDVPMRDGQTLRNKALHAIPHVKWVPDWGETRIRSMVMQRPDWCVSRQRRWGIPIPAFICQNCGQAALTGVVSEAIQTFMANHGSTAWFDTPASSIVPASVTCASCGQHDFEKETDILDVWFESGSSFMGVNHDLSFPAQLYLEGSDQHRGWFQSALFIGLGCLGKPPFETVVTHGFIVDDHGKKMSKSKGNVTAPSVIVRDYGADVLRWWVASSDFKDDISLSRAILDQAKGSFLKVRNTLRFLLGNTYDFDPKTELIAVDQLAVLDRWIVVRAQQMHDVAVSAYTDFSIHRIVHLVHDFCVGDISAHFLDAVKDRLYCDVPDSHRRRSTQSALYYLLDIVLRVLAPILVFTADDAYQHFNHLEKQESIHLVPFLPNGHYSTALAKQEQLDYFDHLFAIKDSVYQQGELLRQKKKIKQFLQMQVILRLPTPLAPLVQFPEWPDFLLVSTVSVTVDPDLTKPVCHVTVVSHMKCERCWRYQPHVGDSVLCRRCDSIIKESLS